MPSSRQQQLLISSEPSDLHDVSTSRDPSLATCRPEDYHYDDVTERMKEKSVDECEV